MSILVLESLATYGGITDLGNSIWEVIHGDALTLLPTGGSEGQPCLQFDFDTTSSTIVETTKSYGELAYPWTHDGVTTIVGFRFKVDNLGTLDIYDKPHIVNFQGHNQRNQWNIFLCFDHEGKVWVGNRTAGTWYGGFQLTVGAWHQFSIKATIAESPTGAYSFLVDGSLIYEESGLDTRYSTVPDMILFGINEDTDGGANVTGVSYSISDIYFQDDLGGSLDDHLISPNVRVSYVPADTDGADTDFTPSAGATNAPMVDEVVGHDYDTTRNVSDGTLTHKDTFSMAALPEPTRGEIFAIQPVIAAKMEEVTPTAARTIKMIQKGTLEGLSAAITLTEDWAYYKEVFLLHPDTSLAWTKAQFASGEFGYGNDT